MYNIVDNEDPSLQKIINLMCFFSIFHGNTLTNHSPDYILEKYEHWVNITLPHMHPKDSIARIEVDFYKYKQIWGETSEKIKVIFYLLSYPYYYQKENKLNWFELNWINCCLNGFKLFGGELGKICSDKKVGIHPNLLKKYLLIMELQKQTIKLMCLAIDEKLFVSKYGNVFSAGLIYDGYKTNSAFGEMWVVAEPSGGYFFHRPLKNFIALAEWREKQINSILED